LVEKTVEVAKIVDPTNHGQPFVFVATYLPLRSWLNVIPFIRLSGEVEAQVLASRGAIRYSVKTDIPRKRFWTLSVWEKREDMALFSRSEPHRTAMKHFYEWGTEAAAIAEWTNADGKIDWKDAERRLKQPAFRYRLEGKRLVHAAGSRSVAED
jgi:hypothetical protein